MYFVEQLSTAIIMYSRREIIQTVADGSRKCADRFRNRNMILLSLPELVVVNLNSMMAYLLGMVSAIEFYQLQTYSCSVDH